MLPSVSIVVPVHNAAEFIADTLRSIATQTLLPMEIVVVDDGSTDGSASVVEGMAQTSPVPIRLIRNRVPEGVARARNRGAASTSGAVLGFCDNDDLWHPRLLELACRRFQEHKEAAAVAVDAIGFGTTQDRPQLISHQRGAMVMHWVEASGIADQLIRAVGPLDDPPTRLVSLADFRRDTTFSTTQVLFRRDAFQGAGGYAAWCFRADDWVLNGAVAALGPIPTVAAPLVFYRVRATSQSHELAASYLPLLSAEVALRFGGPAPDIEPSGAFYRYLVQSYVGAGGGLGRAVGFALVGRGFTPREYGRLVRAWVRARRD